MPRDDYEQIPHYTRNAIDGWVDGTQLNPGHFVTAVLENNLAEAMIRADGKNREVLPTIVMYCLNQIPAACWGSLAKTALWREQMYRQRDAANV